MSHKMLVWFLFVLSLISFQNGLCGMNKTSTEGSGPSPEVVPPQCNKPDLNEARENKVYLCRGATDNVPGQLCNNSKDAKNYCASCHTGGSAIDLLERKVSCDCSNAASYSFKLSCDRNDWQKLGIPVTRSKILCPHN
ncbi:Hypothetical predicted protein [Cloeon dipterum]|uniref:Uncharacterized protein n=1 Tax=Cloeon dipterum TaxID=197152 RepID=A0A8S1CE61_9INSE|nr:Hypothetical predicted protein [Cloeon dipterum]